MPEPFFTVLDEALEFLLVQDRDVRSVDGDDLVADQTGEGARQGFVDGAEVRGDGALGQGESQLGVRCVGCSAGLDLARAASAASAL